MIRLKRLCDTNKDGLQNEKQLLVLVLFSINPSEKTQIHIFERDSNEGHHRKINTSKLSLPQSEIPKTAVDVSLKTTSTNQSNHLSLHHTCFTTFTTDTHTNDNIVLRVFLPCHCHPQITQNTQTAPRLLFSPNVCRMSSRRI